MRHSLFRSTDGSLRGGELIGECHVKVPKVVILEIGGASVIRKGAYPRPGIAHGTMPMPTSLVNATCASKVLEPFSPAAFAIDDREFPSFS